MANLIAPIPAAIALPAMHLTPTLPSSFNSIKNVVGDICDVLHNYLCRILLVYY